MSMVGAGKATIARITAERFGCKDEALLQLIEKLAAADIVIGTPEFSPRSDPAVSLETNEEYVETAFYMLKGTMDGKDFCLVLSGPALEDFDCRERAAQVIVGTLPPEFSAPEHTPKRESSF